ncbi:uncharacterized protein T069G_10479 [Trichoderma breve]|uniref:Uncharacterized protein n=1 Tax=Trichoderma breve TaxID=2034170 RepID=A0A9W9B8F8_9HYPO|nr:uncharacterized protein T069G_10479 [Trichoderma breve]KAJ4854921.1 hypothetical protein T069G_10479 [Trichoderma breve]
MLLSVRILGSAALMAVTASCKQLILNFDDIAISNDNGCGNFTFGEFSVYHDIAVSDAFGTSRVFNATKTPSCNSVLDEDISLALFGRAPSPSNALFISALLDAQIVAANVNTTLVNEASFDILPVFSAAERNSSDVTVRIFTLFSDFGSVDIRNTFEFHTATDGWGPYHVNVSSNGVEYRFLEVDVVLPDEDSQRGGLSPAFFVDNLVLESTE